MSVGHMENAAHLRHREQIEQLFSEELVVSIVVGDICNQSFDVL